MTSTSAGVAVASPYAHEGSSVSTVMFQVCLALLPCTVFAFYLFGWPAINLFLVTCVAAIATELACLALMSQPLARVFDGSALLTAWLLALTLPPWAPWWIAVFGAAFAIAIGKQLYGGVGQNIFNPAMLARTALLVTFPVQMTTWVLPAAASADLAAPSFWQGLRITFLSAPLTDGWTGATALGHVKTSVIAGESLTDVIAQDLAFPAAITGLTAGSMGETSELLVALGGAYLLWKKLISWEIPVAIFCSVVVMAGIFGGLSNIAFHLTSGGLALGMFFIATDPVTSPTGRTAKLIFGAGCGLVIFIIRSWGGFPEAVAFAVLFMNAFTPLIDRYFKPRVYGRLSSGKPLSAAKLAIRLPSRKP